MSIRADTAGRLQGWRTLLQKGQFFLTVLVAVTLPYQIQLNSFLIILLGVAWLAQGNLTSKWNQLRNQPLAFVFASYFFICLFGLLYTSNLREGINRIEISLSILLFPLIFSTSHYSQREQNLVLKSFLFTCAVASLYCFGFALYRHINEGLSFNFLYAFITGTDPDEPYGGHYFSYQYLAQAIHIHAVYLSMYIVFAMFICYFIYLKNWRRLSFFRKGAVTGVLLVLTITLFSLASRTQIFVFFVLLTAAVVHNLLTHVIKPKHLVPLGLVVLLGIALIISNPLTTYRYKDIFSMEQTLSDGNISSVGLRIKLWSSAWKIARNSPFLGMGTGDGQDSLNDVYRKQGYDETFIGLNTHNQYLQILVEIGLLGLTVITAIILISFQYSIKHKNHLHLTLLVVVFVGCMSENLFTAQKGIVFYTFFNSLLAFCRPLPPKR